MFQGNDGGDLETIASDVAINDQARALFTFQLVKSGNIDLFADLEQQLDHRCQADLAEFL